MTQANTDALDRLLFEDADDARSGDEALPDRHQQQADALVRDIQPGADGDGEGGFFRGVGNILTGLPGFAPPTGAGVTLGRDLDPQVKKGQRQQFRSGRRQTTRAAAEATEDVPVLGRATRGIARGTEQVEMAEAAMRVLMSGDDEDFERFARSARLLREMPIEGFESMDEGGVLETAQVIGTNPGAVFEVVMQSMAGFGQKAGPLMVAGAPAGPVGIGAGAFAGSSMLEFGGALNENLRERGIDVENPEAMRRAFDERPDDVREAINAAARKAGVIGLVDGISGGIAGRVLRPTQAATRAGRGLRGAGELGIQSGLGGTGEALGQLAESGEITSPGEIMLEAIAEFGTGPIEIGINVLSEQELSVRDAASREQAGRGPNTDATKLNTEALSETQTGAALPTDPVGVRIRSIQTQEGQEVTVTPETAEQQAQLDAEDQAADAADSRAEAQVGETVPEDQLADLRSRLRNIRGATQFTERTFGTTSRRATTLDQVQELSRELRRIVTQTLPDATLRESGVFQALDDVVQGKQLRATQKAFNRALNRVEAAINANQRRLRIREVRTGLRNLRPRRRKTAEPALSRLADRVLRSFSATAKDARGQSFRDLSDQVESATGGTIDAFEGQTLERIEGKKLSDIAPKDLRVLRNVIQKLDHLIATENKARVAGQQVERSRVRQAMVSEIDQSRSTLLGEPSRDPETGEPARTGFTGQTLAIFRNVALGRPENMQLHDLLNDIGGSANSVLAQVGYYDVDAANDAYLDAHNEETDAMAEAITEQGLDISALANISDRYATLQSKIAALMRGGVRRALRREAPREGVALASGRTVQMTRAEMMNIVVGHRDPETRAGTLAGRAMTREATGRDTRQQFTLTEPDLQAIEARLSPQEKALVDHVTRRISERWRSEFAKASMQLFGEDKTVGTPETYYPRTTISTAERVEQALETGNFLEATEQSAGITKDRVGGGVLIVRDFFADFEAKANMHHGLVNLGPALQEARAAFLSPASPVNQRIRRSKAGQRIVERLQDQYRLGAQEILGGGQRTALDKIADRLVRNVSVGLLGLNPAVILYQISSIQMALTSMRKRDVMISLIKGEMFRKRNTEAQMADGYFARRSAGTSTGVLSEALGTGQPSPVIDAIMGPFRFMDQRAVSTIHGAGRNQAKREGYQGQEREDRALQIAKRVLKETQPTWDWLHMSGIGIKGKLRGGGPWKLARMFRSQVQKLMSIFLRGHGQLTRGRTFAERYKGARDMAHATIINGFMLAMMWTVARTLTEAMGEAFSDDPEWDELVNLRERAGEGLAEWIKRSVSLPLFSESLTPLVTHFGAPEIVDRTLGEDVAAKMRSRPTFGAEATPVIGLFNDLGQSVTRMGSDLVSSDEVEIEQHVKNLSRVMMPLSAIAGIPLSSPLREVERAMEQTEEPKRDSSKFRTSGL